MADGDSGGWWRVAVAVKAGQLSAVLLLSCL